MLNRNITPDNPMLVAALEYAGRGWSIFPAPVGEKKSHKSAARTANGERWGATKQPDEVRSDFRRWPGANVGIPTGVANGIFVLEVDTIAGGHAADGIAALSDLESKHGKLPVTSTAESPSGSLHYYFLYPPGVEVRNSESAIAPGIDIRGEGGMVIAPPSQKPGVGVYVWKNPGVPIREAPNWLLDLIVEATKPKVLTISAQAAALVWPPPPVAGSLEGKRTAAWLTTALNAEVALVAQAIKGTRNAQLFKSTANLVGYIKAGANLSESAVTDAMIAASISNGEMADDGKFIITSTIKSAFKTADPRPLPDFSPTINAKPIGENVVRLVAAPVPGSSPGEIEVEPEAPLFSEIDLSTTFVERHEENLRYVAKWGSWLIWDRVRWEFDETMRAFDLSRAICREAAKQANKPSEQKALASAKTVAAVERLAKAYRTLAATVAQWDAVPRKFNDTTATIDLNTGTAHAPDRKDYITQKAGCEAAPVGTPHPIWSSFLDRITDHDVELMTFLQRYIGYCLTGETSEHVFVFAYGTGANGKGVFLNTIAKVFGEYATVADMATFIDSKNDRHPTELAKLRGSRLVVAQETQQGRCWDEAKVKAITGGDKQTARFMRQDFFDFYPTFKLFIVGNHKPTLKNVDEAMRRACCWFRSPFAFPRPSATLT
jgi:putative DNA primase/helicase